MISLSINSSFTCYIIFYFLYLLYYYFYFLIIFIIITFSFSLLYIPSFMLSFNWNFHHQTLNFPFTVLHVQRCNSVDIHENNISQNRSVTNYQIIIFHMIGDSSCASQVIEFDQTFIDIIHTKSRASCIYSLPVRRVTRLFLLKAKNELTLLQVRLPRKGIQWNQISILHLSLWSCLLHRLHSKTILLFNI